MKTHREKDDHPLRIPVERIKDGGLAVTNTLKVADIASMLGDDGPFTPAREGSIDVQLNKADPVVHVRGKAKIPLKSECSRCLDPVELELGADLEVALFPAGDEPAPAPSGELDSEDLGVSTYDHDEIDLLAVLRDEVFLEAPMHPLCDADCSGLCPQCGANLNRESCQCEPVVDPRWTALKGIKENMN